MARTQLPLRLLAWAVTARKSQGLTLPRIRLGLGPKEFSCGLTFLALSRITSLKGLLFIEKLDWERVKIEEARWKILAVAIRGHGP